MRGRFGAFGPFGAAWAEAWEEWERFGPWRMRTLGRRVERGDVKYLLLTVLKDGPKHGYEIIREIERRAGGGYTPSPGTIYPTLQMLEDMGHVRSQMREERRVYELTEAGRSYLEQNQEAADAAWQQFRGHHWRWPFVGFGTEEQRQLQGELMALARSLFASGRIFSADAKTIGEVREAIRVARERVDAAFAGEAKA